MRHSILLPLAATLAFASLAGCRSSSVENISAEAREARQAIENKVVEVQAQVSDDVVPAAYQSDVAARHAQEAAFLAQRDALRDRTQARLDRLARRADRIRNDADARNPYVELRSAMANIDNRLEALRVDILRLEGTSEDELSDMDATIQGHFRELEQAIGEIAAPAAAAAD